MAETPKPQSFKEFKDWAEKEDPEAAVNAKVARERAVRNLKQERAISPEVSTVDPNKLEADKTALGNKIIDLAGGGDVLGNGVTLAVLATPSHDRLTATRTSSGSVLSVGLEQQLDEGVVTTQFKEGSLADKAGGLNEFLTVEKTDGKGGTSSGLMVQIGISEVNHGQVIGREWQPDAENEEMSRPYITPEASDEALNTAMANIAAAVASVEQHAA